MGVVATANAASNATDFPRFTGVSVISVGLKQWHVILIK
jgi:hypothetical protein